jgi:LemA protein
MIAVLTLIGLLILLVVIVYNRLITLKVRTAEAWAQIDVQLKLRADLVPNLVETVKGYAAHEKTTLENVIKARAAVAEGGAAGPAKTAEANNMLTGALKSLFAVTENYPELKANQNFIMLQTELSGIEAKIAYARQFYNENVMAYNQYQTAMPGVFFAGMFGHKNSEFFAAQEEDKKAPTVRF